MSTPCRRGVPPAAGFCCFPESSPPPREIPLRSQPDGSGTNAAKTVTATFTLGGSYTLTVARSPSHAHRRTLTVTLWNAAGLTATSSVTASVVPQTRWLMSDSAGGHAFGRADADGWSANTTQVAPGARTTSWELMVDNNTFTGDTGTFQLQPTPDVPVPFTMPTARVGNQIGLRVYWRRRSYVCERSVSVQ